MILSSYFPYINKSLMHSYLFTYSYLCQQIFDKKKKPDSISVSYDTWYTRVLSRISTKVDVLLDKNNV
jgi:hypothetical protein